ncbi:MAG: hypothetical protein Q8760_02600, partial [Candidatus Phytoplasma australasiaticum]|nr:hypothetical protein [Candidatus Phytoplasma australasiaticum]
KEFNVFYLFDATQREKVQTLYHQSTPALIFLSFVLNKACPLDPYPLSSIHQMINETVGTELMSFMGRIQRLPPNHDGRAR